MVDSSETIVAKRFKIIKQIGAGTFGVVFQGTIYFNPTSSRHSNVKNGCNKNSNLKC